MFQAPEEDLDNDEETNQDTKLTSNNPPNPHNTWREGVTADAEFQIPLGLSDTDEILANNVLRTIVMYKDASKENKLPTPKVFFYDNFLCEEALIDMKQYGSEIFAVIAGICKELGMDQVEIYRQSINIPKFKMFL